jgi:hypothetical protein
MKLLRKNIFFSLMVISVFAPASVSAMTLDLGLAGGAGNMAFDSESEKPLGADAEAFSPNYLPWAYVNLAAEYSERIDFSVRFEQDLLLRRRAIGALGLNYEYLRIEFGPFAGFFNTPETPLNPGITGSFTLRYPGIIFGSVKAASTLGSRTDFPGDYAQTSGEAALGFWLPNVIPVFSFNMKSFTRRMNETLLVRDELLRYGLSADIFSKNVPYTIRVDIGYESLKRSYTPAGGALGKTETDELKSIYAGFEGTWRIIPRLRLLLGLEMPVYSWAAQPLKKPGHGAVLFQSHAGIIYSFGEL